MVDIQLELIGWNMSYCSLSHIKLVAWFKCSRWAENEWQSFSETCANWVQHLKMRPAFYSPSHRDLHGDLGDPAILGYQEHPEITHRETNILSISYPTLLLTSIPTTASPVIHMHRPTKTEAKTRVEKEISLKIKYPPPQTPLLSPSRSRTHAETQMYTHSCTNSHFDCLSQLKLHWRWVLMLFP